MVWIRPGALVAGTPKDWLPRKADAEMLGEQVILHGYYIDVFPYPNEEGAIPLTNVTQAEAQALCSARDKRLCSELEWERACKGPENLPYEYGDRHRPERCGTGVEPSLRPSGLRVGCRSDFGVRDLHGGGFEWTSSPWGRGAGSNAVAVRAGNGNAGEVMARCANAEPRAPDTKSGVIGFRCCAGPANDAEVTLNPRVGKHLEEFERVERQRSARLIGALPEEALRVLRGGPPRIERLWTWRPVPNEELETAAICSGLGVHPVCGVLVARVELGSARAVAWAPSGLFIASLHMERDPRDLWLLGGDEVGRFKRLISYAWGRISVHAEDRNVGKIEKKKKKKKK
jgi:sulfatase modifying factor 1